MFHDGHYGNHSRHKMTTDRQYSLLKNSMAEFYQKNLVKKHNPDGTSRYKQDYLHWTDLTRKLNKLGPPHRTIQQWKKVWCDYKRAEKKRRAKPAPEPKKETICDDESALGINISEATTASDSEVHIKSENKDNDQNSQSIYSVYSNEYDNDYSYPDDDSLLDLCKEDSAPFIPDESSSGSYNYASHNFNEPAAIRSFDQSSSNYKHFSTPPPLQPSNAAMHSQTLYTIQNQMEHQTKLLDNLAQMSGAMTCLMERQVQAVEKQTEALRRQASATERHTAVMNIFFDLIREKMVHTNSQKTSAATDGFPNDIF